MDVGVLPLAFYCRNAQLCLQKAGEARQASLGEEELQHWKAFTALVTSSIPTHPQFRGWKGLQEAQALDLHAHIAEAKQRIPELENSGHLDRPAANGPKQQQQQQPPPPPKPVVDRKSMTTSKPKFFSSSELMLKTSKSVRISEGASKRWDIETYGAAKATQTTAKPVSLVQRLRPRPRPAAASPTRASKDVTRPLSAQGTHTPTSGEITPYCATPRSRDASRIRGGAGISGRGSTGLKALASGKGRSSDEDRGSAKGPWVRGILRNPGAEDATMAKVTLEDEEELIEWTPSRQESARLSQRSSISEESLEARHPGRLREWKGGLVRREHESVEASNNRHAPPTPQRRVKENCDRFRRQMKLLKEKAEDTRVREEEVESMSERLQRRLADLDQEPDEELCEAHGAGDPSLERTSLESLNRTMTRLMNGDYSRPEKRVKTNASNSGSESSSQASLPLSHYIQKLRDSRVKNSQQVEVLEKKISAKSFSRTGSKEMNLSPGSSTQAAILLPTSPSSGSPKHRLGNRLKSQVWLDSAMVPSQGAIVAARHVQDGGKLQEQKLFLYPPDEPRARVLSRSIHEGAHHDANDEKIAQLQRVLGELRGSMEGMKIRIEVEGEGWRGHVDRLEKELESVKETDDEVKKSFKDEVKMKLSEFMTSTEKLLRREREQVMVMVQERIENQLNGQGGCGADMKREMQLLWNEMESLVKNREDMAGHIEHLTFVTKKVQENSNREQDMLKSENDCLRKQLQSLQDEGVQVTSEADKEELRQAVENLKNDGSDLKLEIQGLRNIEKILKVELEELRTRLGKVQDETEELEREKEMTLGEGTRERLLIMDRVESLSQLYLGGLEEVRQDLEHLKYGCGERVEEIESQWNDLKRKQGITCEEAGSASLPRQVLLEELDQFRSEIAKMLVMERGLLKETLEMESTSIWRIVMDAYANNKSEMLNMLKTEIQKQLHSAREKVLLMTDALKRDMDALKTDISHTQDGAEEMSHIVLAAEGKKEVAAQAAADASSLAAKAREILTDMLVSVEREVNHARHESMLLQENLATQKELAAAAASETRMVSQVVLKEKEAALVAFQEVRQMSQELQDYLEKESPKLVTAMVVVQKERDTASQAAAEATSSAMKAGELLAEVLGSFNLEMTKARHMNMQLQEELELERGLSTQHSQEVQKRLSEELEVAISTWKRAMNEDVAKAKEILEALDKENNRQGFSVPVDLENYISQNEEKLNDLMTTVGLLQDSTNNHRDEKKRLKQHENERNEKDLTANISQLNQVVRAVEERVNETSSEQTELRKRLKRSEGVQTGLVHSLGEVRTNTCTLEKTMNLFLPQYDAAARIVNEISCKVERLKERIEGFACDEGLAQVMSRVAETKIESLKEFAFSAAGLQDLRELQNRVENNDHSQTIAEVESRVAVMECTLSDIQNGGQSSEKGVLTLTENVDALKRKMDILEQNGVLSEEQEPVTSARLVAIESRVEHVASATFSNLQLLDNKVELVSTGVQSALEGAALAENKCGALGAELVKVFRMLTATKMAGGGTNWPPQPSPADDSIRPPRGRSHSPPSRSTTQRLESRSQSPPPRLSGNPAWNSSRGGPAFSLRRSAASVATRHKPREKWLGVRSGHNVEPNASSGPARRDLELEEGSPQKGADTWLKSYPRESLPGFKDGGQLRGQALAVVEHRQWPGPPYLTIDRRPKNLQKTNIRLESGRIHVNVSRRSGAAASAGAM